jgi:MOSC domain-containing protein YiiM
MEDWMKVVSVNVGMPREIMTKMGPVTTGIFKQPIAGPVMIRTLNLDGDRQADLNVHGGPQKAVYGYPTEHYPYWHEQLPQTTTTPGMFGENLTTEGLFEDSLYIGDRLKVGNAVVEVTQPRMPCYKLALRFERDDMIKRFLASGKSGFYFSVVEEGIVSSGSRIEIVSRDGFKVSVSDITRLYISHEPDTELLERAVSVQALPQSWKDYLVHKAQARAARR